MHKSLFMWNLKVKEADKRKKGDQPILRLYRLFLRFIYEMKSISISSIVVFIPRDISCVII